MIEMDLVRKGRLSVQRVHENAWNAISLLTKEGGWEDMDLKPKKGPPKKAAKPAKSPAKRGRGAKGKTMDDEEESEEDDSDRELEKSTSKRKRKAAEVPDDSERASPVRRSRRAKR